MTNNNLYAFFDLLRAGLWEQDISELRVEGITDWNEVYQLALEQSVQGLVLQGIDELKNKIEDHSIPQTLLLQWIGEVQMIEQQNRSMNVFLAKLINRLRAAQVYALLVKGQGVALCYEKPLWRSPGDVDLFLSAENYSNAKSLLTPIASSVEKEYINAMHLGMTIDGYVVELHGTLQCNLSPRVRRGIEEIEKEIIYGGLVRSWTNGRVQVFMPEASNDAVYVFAHFLNHFYKDGVGLRQICDWCRLLWTYRDRIDVKKIENRIHKMGLASEWNSFGAFAVKYLGMPADAIPMYYASPKWERKAKRILGFVIMSGNFGRNRDSSYRRYPYFIRKCFSMARRIGDLLNHARIFPLDSLRFFPRIMYDGLRSAVRGE